MSLSLTRLGPAFLIVLACLSGPSRAALLGDVDGDGRVTTLDAVRLIQVAAGVRTPLHRDRLLGDVAPPRSTALVNEGRHEYGDGTLDVQDVVAVLRIAVGLAKKRDLGPVVIDLAGSGPPSLQDVRKTLAQNPEKTRDGPAQSIYLFDPWDMAIAPDGVIFFTEYGTGRIRKLSPDGQVTTLSGGLFPGFADGPPAVARFYRPEGITFLPDGSLVVADTYNHAIRRISLNGWVSTLAGNGKPGRQDGRGRDASFNTPSGISTDPDGNIYVADTFNNLIRKVTPDGQVTTLAGTGASGYYDTNPLGSTFLNPGGLLYDPRDGGVFVADTGNHAIRKITQGRVTTLAGNGTPGFLDGSGPTTRFNNPFSVALDAQDRLYIADWINERVRVLLPNGSVNTLAGSEGYGYRDGPALSAKLKGLMNVRVGPNGWVYLADTDNERIRVIAP